MNKRLLLAAVLLGLLGACQESERMKKVKQEVARIEQKPAGKVKPAPEFSVAPSFTYNAHRFRSPFEMPMVAPTEVPKRIQGKQVEPDFIRAPEVLESYPIEQLMMVGTLKKSDGDLWALITDPSGNTHVVKSGNYLGKNHGKIAAISSRSLEVYEIIPDGLDGWVERPRVIELKEVE